MAWIVDTYEKLKGFSKPSVITGKPLEMGGSLGRGKATAQGGIFVLFEALNVHYVKANIILELANGPVTPEAEKVLIDKGILIIPGVLANSVGVTVSYFEWVQGRTGE